MPGTFAIPLGAGRELDALVAERVMGWKWVPLDKHFHRTDCVIEDGAIVSTHLRDDSVLRAEAHVGPYCSPPPRYSTDIAAAWEVLDHIGRLVSICLMDGGVWSCKFIGQERVTAPTAPEAICRAALAWAARKP